MKYCFFYLFFVFCFFWYLFAFFCFLVVICSFLYFICFLFICRFFKPYGLDSPNQIAPSKKKYDEFVVFVLCLVCLVFFSCFFCDYFIFVFCLFSFYLYFSNSNHMGWTAQSKYFCSNKRLDSSKHKIIL